MNVRKLEAVKMALAEDVGLGDVTTQATVAPDRFGTGRLWVKESGVLAGLDAALLVFQEVDPDLVFEANAADGEALEAGTTIASVRGRLGSILTAERTALNFLQRLSGIATRTRSFVELLRGTGVAVIDTRKTTPGLRAFEKDAVRAGGGQNHRWGLDSGVLIKDNHIFAAGGVGAALRAARAYAPHALKLEIECKRLEQVREALDEGADIIMLDNMRGERLQSALEMIGTRAQVEVSGGIREETIQDVALPGVDWISVGALTHSVRSLDIALDLEERKDGK